ncbi:hypothetical protein KJ761_03325 [Patescibacteria group bacterium]|nr:hypothetical protein [Patescibacteria group bacterium]
MEEQKNLNNPLVGQPVTAAAPKNISTMAGALIILIVAVLVGLGMVYFFPSDFFVNSYSQNSLTPGKSLKSKTETINTQEKEIAAPAPGEEKTTQPAAALDFDYELKKLDDQNNAVNSDDFNENEMSDANIGL